jgi:hypothetical protein
MSGPLARSAHMRMKMNREKSAGTTPRPSPRNTSLSPSAEADNKELLLATAMGSTVTLPSEVTEKEAPVAAEEHQSIPSRRSLSSSVAIRSRSRSRSRARESIGSSEFEGGCAVDTTTTSLAPPRVQLSRDPSTISPSALGLDNAPPAMPEQQSINSISETHPRPVFNTTSHGNYSRSRKYEYPQFHQNMQQQYGEAPQAQEYIPGDSTESTAINSHHDSAHDDLNIYNPSDKDGSKMMTIEGHDENFVYPSEEYNEDFEYHTNDDEISDRLGTNTDQTVNSEDVQTGTPVRKKDRKRKKKKNKFLIENVNDAKSNPRYAIHNSWSQEEDEDILLPPTFNKNVTTAHNIKYNDIKEKEIPMQALSPNESEERKVVLPHRIGTSKSWDSSKIDTERAVTSSKSWDAPSESENSSHHGWKDTKKKQRNIWTEEYDENEHNNPRRHRHIIGAHSNVHNKDGAFFKPDPFADAVHEVKKNIAIKDVFASWDGAGPEWVDSTENDTEGVVSDKGETEQKELYWTKKSFDSIQNTLPVESETRIETGKVSDYEDDDDSIFAFEKEEEEKKKDELQLPPSNPQDIFTKLNKGLKQAERTKNVALRGDSLSNAGSNLSKDASEPSEKSKTGKRNVAFAKDKDNTIHTYLVEKNHVDSHDSSSNVESTDDGKIKQMEQMCVQYQSDEDSANHTNEESTMGSSYRSNKSGNTTEHDEEGGITLLDTVADIAASLGDLFASSANTATKADDKESIGNSTDQDDYTAEQSTLQSQDNTEKSDDWLGYMENVLFPSNKKSTSRPSYTVRHDGERSVQTEISECSESNYTESQCSESQSQSFKITYDDSYADGEDGDAYLFEQALASARAIHHLHGVEYDETREIDVVTDVKFHVANITLPLGRE